MTIRLLLADDHAMVRKGLQVFLSTQTDILVVGEASNGEETLELAASLAPDIILMDLNMPILDGITTTRRLRASRAVAKIIVMTSFCDRAHVLAAVQAGVQGYLMKDIEPEELANSIRRVYQGQVDLHPLAAGELMNTIAFPDDSPTPEPYSSPLPPTLDPLTPREREVLVLIARGQSNRQIAEALTITEKTVKTHVSHLLDKLGLADRTQAAILALKSGWTD